MRRSEDQKMERLGEERLNKQGCLMKIVEYNKADDIEVEFQDKYKVIVHTNYTQFCEGVVKNPYFPSVFRFGKIGQKYPVSINKKAIKEYDAWRSILIRCFDEREKEKHHTYRNATCCEEWLLYENFYEWLHSQNNFDKWLNGRLWAIDKDILIKGNKVYAPNTCCLVPDNVNKLFTKSDSARGNLLIGVRRCGDKFQARCKNPFIGQLEHLGTYSIIEDAFSAYKKRKEEIIKLVAKDEFNKGNIIKECYDAMINYKVEITDQVAYQ